MITIRLVCDRCGEVLGLAKADESFSRIMVRGMAPPHKECKAGRQFPITINERAMLVVVRQYDADGEEIEIGNISPSMEYYVSG